MTSIKNKIETLRKELHQHNYNYYLLDKPIISDYDFDMKLKELESLEFKNPEFFDPNSPTQRIGGGLTKKFDTVTHTYKMYSLDNSYSLDDLKDWEQRLQKTLGDVQMSYTCEPKYDGASISIIYKDGKLFRAVTRGDGVQGDDITQNIRTIKSIPLELRGDAPDNLEVRGEIVMPLDIFKNINNERVKNGEEPYMNPRNTTSGSLKIQDSSEVAKRRLDAFIYGVAGDIDTPKNQSECLKKFKEWGFKIPYEVEVLNSIEQVFENIHLWEKKRFQLPYEIDGMVIKCNDFNHQKELGHTSKFPRWAIAYKFKTERVSTVIESVSYQVGRTGAITPVANLKPVLLGGTVVKRASLHNENQIKKLELHNGDTVFVEKGGEIIPKIVGLDKKKRLENALPVNYIFNCPECESELIKKEGEASHYCHNFYACPPQIKGRIEHFISRKAMNIEGLGSETIGLFVDNNLIKNYADLYDLKKNQILILDRMADKSTDNIIEGIGVSKNIPFNRVLYALGIRYVGETVAKKLASHFLSIDNLKKASLQELESVNDIGLRIAESIISFFQDEENVAIIDKLKNHGLQLDQKTDDVLKISDRFLNQIFVVSGVFSVSRDDLKTQIEKNGGKVGSSISSKTNFLVAGDKMGPSKKEKAEKLGVLIISEQDFQKMLE